MPGRDVHNATSIMAVVLLNRYSPAPRDEGHRPNDHDYRSVGDRPAAGRRADARVVEHDAEGRPDRPSRDIRRDHAHGFGAGWRAGSFPAGCRAGSLAVAGSVRRNPSGLLLLPAQGLRLWRPKPYLPDRARPGTAAGGVDLRPRAGRGPADAGRAWRRPAQRRSARPGVAGEPQSHGDNPGTASPAPAGDPLRGADGIHHRGLHRGRWPRRAGRRPHVRAQDRLHRMAERRRGTLADAPRLVAATRGRRGLPAHRMVAGCGGRNYRDDRLRHRDLGSVARPDGPCRRASRDVGAVRCPHGHASAGRILWPA